jgi:hypothetical protein
MRDRIAVALRDVNGQRARPVGRKLSNVKLALDQGG